MSLSQSRGYIKVAAIVASLVITTVMFCSLIWIVGADQLPDQNDVAMIS